MIYWRNKAHVMLIVAIMLASGIIVGFSGVRGISDEQFPLLPISHHGIYTINETNNGDTIHLMPGYLLIVHLKTLGSAGYQWHIKPYNKTVLNLTGHYTQDNNPPGYVGGAVDEHWIFSVLSIGDTQLTFLYMPPCDTQPSEQFSVRVLVSNMIITILYPNGGETLRQGSVCAITWSTLTREGYSIPDVSLDIDLYKGDQRYMKIANGISILNEKYDWAILPDAPSGNDYRIKIYEEANPDLIFDFSDNYFSIGKGSEIELTLDTQPFGLALHDVFTLNPRPVRILPILDGRLHAIYEKGSTVSITANSTYGKYKFSYWTGTNISRIETNNPLIIKLDKSCNYTAHYVKSLISVENKVWDESSHTWKDRVDIVVRSGETPPIARFKCTIKPYILPLDYVNQLSSIYPYKTTLIAFDRLPKNLKYIEGSSNYKPIYNEEYNTLSWSKLPLSDTTIYFNTTIVGKGLGVNNFTGCILYGNITPLPEPLLENYFIRSICMSDTAIVNVVSSQNYILNVLVSPEESGYVDVTP